MDIRTAIAENYHFVIAFRIKFTITGGWSIELPVEPAIDAKWTPLDSYQDRQGADGETGRMRRPIVHKSNVN